MKLQAFFDQWSYGQDAWRASTCSYAVGVLQVIGWENIELISDRPLETMLDEFARLKKEFPGRILIASIMEEYDRVRPAYVSPTLTMTLLLEAVLEL
jgi:hypothetical protein